MSSIRNCLLPGDLAYHVEYNVWLRDRGDGTFELGMTDIAQTMAGAILHCRPKEAGKSVKEGKGLATVESGKWVGPVRAPFACEVVAVNDAVEKDAALLNRSPYRDGWIVRVRPSEGEAALVALARGEAAVEGFSKYMAEKNLPDCIHCEGFEG